MRQLFSIVKATALEILSEPLSLLVLLAALTLAVMAPAFHYHQFGEVTRMARDAGFSALFTCGSVLAVFGTIRAFRREVESGTLAMALAHPVSRAGFFLAKTIGAFAAYAVFFTVVFATEMTIVEGAAIGGYIAARTGDIARVFGPFLAGGVAMILAPLVVGAFLNRFARCRFVLSAFVVALVLSIVALAVVAALNPPIVPRYLTAVVPLAFAAAVLLSAAAAFSARFRANAAASATGLVFAAFVPAIGNYYLADALSNGGTVGLGYVALVAAAALPAVVAFLLLGIGFMNERDVS